MCPCVTNLIADEETHSFRGATVTQNTEDLDREVKTSMAVETTLASTIMGLHAIDVGEVKAKDLPSTVV